MITSGLNNGRSKTSVVNKSIFLNILCLLEPVMESEHTVSISEFGAQYKILIQHVKSFDMPLQLRLGN